MQRGREVMMSMSLTLLMEKTLFIVVVEFGVMAVAIRVGWSRDSGTRVPPFCFLTLVVSHFVVYAY